MHSESVERTLERLSSSINGISDAEAATRLQESGPNRLPEPKQKHPVLKFLSHFHNVLIYVLIGSAVVTALLGHWLDTWIILAVVVINALIGYIQEGKAEKALDAVRNMLSLHATVIRDGKKHEIDAENVAPGDLVFIKSGDRVPADVRIIEAKDLRVNEASLTGESEAVEKTPDAVGADASLGDRTSMAYSGTLVVSGQGTGVVTETGAGTELGKINEMLSDVKQLTTPLTRQLAQFGGYLTAVILVIAAITFVVGYFVAGMPLDDIFLAVVGLAVASIPEGLPAIMTIILAIGVQRMAKRNAIIRRLPGVETLGAVTVICSDKTGTLTRSEMAAVRIVAVDRTYAVTGVGYAPDGKVTKAENGDATDGMRADPNGDSPFDLLLSAVVLCNDARLRKEDGEWIVEGLPTEGALLTFGAKAGCDADTVEKVWKRVDTIPFESEHKYMATLNARESDGTRKIFLKGAPERVFERCARVLGADGEADFDAESWKSREEELADDGNRVLAVAYKNVGKDVDDIGHDDAREGFVLLGLVALIDPPREEAITAVRECHDAGIRVKMITGDHALTARSIAAQLGIGDGKTVVTGTELEETPDNALPDLVNRVDVFARVSPEHKLRLVTALQKHGYIVAMTGDGVNDAPALKKSDIGIAMGIKGTEAAKEAAEMVLADDNFASIANAVEEGRTVYDNLKKALLFLLPTNGGEGLIIVAAIILGFTLPITPAQILWVNMVTAVTLALSLAFEPMEKNVMKRAPRDPGEALVPGAFLAMIAFVSFLLMAISFGLFSWFYANGAEIETARTIAVNALIIGEIFFLFNSRLMTETSFSRKGLVATRYVWGTSIAVLVLQMGFSYLPFMNALFGTAPIGFTEWGIMFACGFGLFAIVEIAKIPFRKAITKTRSTSP
ncbi:MAG: cation-transporting P-type ATPase [Spirochaetaceae bacterium]|nr:MAG: cation-transporting P-type ATPase [Spirochaetaceae bacterium]